MPRPDPRRGSRSAPGALAWAGALDVLSPFLAAVGPRRHEDWTADVLPVLERRTSEPRGWRTVDVHAVDRTPKHRSFPLRPLTVADLDRDLELVTYEGATRLLVRQAVELAHRPWEAPGYAPGYGTEYGTPGRAAAVVAAARTVLARFGPEAEYATNAMDLSEPGEPEPGPGDLGGGLAVSGFALPEAHEYVMDLGVIVASPAEVGVFWGYFID
ncbi:hypothetical protein [Streptomyces sp. NPDC048172]|uniref:hypothetical protein n=1 Tax=Streptomyces sp. NPDC048172 TaxID=3365505 RepID=UPI00371848E3